MCVVVEEDKALEAKACGCCCRRGFVVVRGREAAGCHMHVMVTCASSAAKQRQQQQQQQQRRHDDDDQLHNETKRYLKQKSCYDLRGSVQTSKQPQTQSTKTVQKMMNNRPSLNTESTAATKEGRRPNSPKMSQFQTKKTQPIMVNVWHAAASDLK